MIIITISIIIFTFTDFSIISFFLSFISTCPLYVWCYVIITIIVPIIISINFLIFFSPFFCFLLFFNFFFLLLIKQLLFSHESVKVSKRHCLMFVCLFLELKLYGNNSQPHCFSPVPIRFTVLFIYCYFDIILHFILNFTIFVATCFISNLL